MNKKTTGDKAIALLLVLLTVSFGLGGCASVPTDPDDRAVYEENNDPLEPFNRGVFGFNQTFDKYLLKPVAQGYDYVLPQYAQDRVHSFLENLGEPVNLINNILQGRGSDAMDTTGRFLVNTTVGVAGLFDVATDMGVPERHADFGQTLYSYGVGTGPYLVLPLFGPSNPRDGVGLAADIVMDPWSYVANAAFDRDTAVAVTAARFGTQIVDARAQALPVTDQLEAQSFDYYATMRSISRQYRAKQLQGEATEVSGSPGGVSASPGTN